MQILLKNKRIKKFLSDFFLHLFFIFTRNCNHSKKNTLIKKFNFYNEFCFWHVYKLYF
jgi:hypothetical protein